ncbi:hypothetical protein FNV43_RR26507 [Rhamnella rubrinervis]|uniref:Chloroplastic group IIB intron splicing facilitator CRS2, chloroplastic n=1 Tax=Rhamnella rubrinervis TaxID=2594499 RepID=A0A8K0GNU4_9ROSA|nr:hypothetical protein FNV43_RR26507 [Rhamnella rubrinervis]
MWYTVTHSNFCVFYPRSPCSKHSLQKHSVSTSRIRASLPDHKNGVKAEYTPWLIVGLGNPGNKYHGTRHNVGFEMIDSISQAQGIAMNTIQSKALIGIGSIEEVPILLVKPQSYMNFSGESVGPLAAHYQVPLRHILLIYDEMSLPNGVLRLQPKGGHGHHNGVKSVMGHLDGRREFPRLCIGIGNPPGTMDIKAFLLQKFSTVERHQKTISSQPLGPKNANFLHEYNQKSPQLSPAILNSIANFSPSISVKSNIQTFNNFRYEQIDAALGQGIEAVRTLVLNGFSDNITRFNLGQKYKYHKV